MIILKNVPNFIDKVVVVIRFGKKQLNNECVLFLTGRSYLCSVFRIKINLNCIQLVVTSLAQSFYSHFKNLIIRSTIYPINV